MDQYLAILHEVRVWDGSKVWNIYGNGGISVALMQFEKLHDLKLDVTSGLFPPNKVNITLAIPPPGHMTSAFQKSVERTARDGVICLFGPLSWLAKGNWVRRDGDIERVPSVFLVPHCIGEKSTAWFVWSRDHGGTWSNLDFTRDGKPPLYSTLYASVSKAVDVKKRYT